MLDIKITPADVRKYPYHTEGSIKGIKFIEGLPTFTLTGYVENLEMDRVSIRRAFLLLLGEDTNTSWIMAQVAHELYVRNVIDEQEYDRLCYD